MRKIGVTEVRKIVKDHNAAVKVIHDLKVTPVPSDIFENIRWNYHITDLKDPLAYRRICREKWQSTYPETDKIVWDNKQKKAITKKFKGIDEGAPAYEWTLKTPMSLLPPTAQVNLYSEDSKFSVDGLIYDINQCDLKGERYLFSSDMKTCQKFWREPAEKNDSSNPFWKPPERRLEENANEIEEGWINSLQKLRCLSQGNFYNEILIGVRKDALMGIFYSTQNSGIGDSVLTSDGRALKDRLTAKARQELVKKNYPSIYPY